MHVITSTLHWFDTFVMVCLKLTVGQHIVKTDMYLMFDIGMESTMSMLWTVE